MFPAEPLCRASLAQENGPWTVPLSGDTPRRGPGQCGGAVSFRMFYRPLLHTFSSRLVRKVYAKENPLMEPSQKAAGLLAAAEAFLARGASIQYDQLSMDRLFRGGHRPAPAFSGLRPVCPLCLLHCLRPGAGGGCHLEHAGAGQAPGLRLLSHPPGDPRGPGPHPGGGPLPPPPRGRPGHAVPQQRAHRSVRRGGLFLPLYREGR